MVAGPANTGNRGPDVQGFREEMSVRCSLLPSRKTTQAWRRASSSGPSSASSSGGVEDGGLAREVVEEGPLADPQALRQVLHPGRLEALSPEQLQRHGEDRLALLEFLLLPQAHAPPRAPTH